MIGLLAVVVSMFLAIFDLFESLERVRFPKHKNQNAHYNLSLCRRFHFLQFKNQNANINFSFVNNQDSPGVKLRSVNDFLGKCTY